MGTRRFLPAGSRGEFAEVNGEPALVFRVGSEALFVLSIEVEEGHIQAIRIIANPEKLARI
jgi:RNA polymerase sigma-70 factor, ECF subfamily